MTKLAEMSVPEAASKAIELMLYGEYEDAKQPKYSWRAPFTGTFEEYLVDRLNDFTDEDETPDLTNESLWQELKYEGTKGSRDGWTGEKVADFGGEGKGDQYWMVVSVSDGETTRYFRRDGWYASYDGGYLDGDIREVTPREKVVVEYA